MMFSHRRLWIGPIHWSLVHNEPMHRLMNPTRRVGGFIQWERRWLCATLRLESWFLNLDVDIR